MGDDKTKEQAAQEAAAQEDVELAEDEAEDVKGGKLNPDQQGLKGR